MAALNLCEILDSSLVENVIQRYSREPLADSESFRVLLGSYFCDRVFLASDWSRLAQVISENHASVSLVLPVFSQERLADGRAATMQALSLFDSNCDEIVVNDPATASLIHNLGPKYKVVLGRLMYKNSRDPRMPEYQEADVSEVIKGILSWSKKIADVKAVEIDSLIDTNLQSLSLSSGIEIRLHRPLCYISTGFVCKAGSNHLSLEQKFRPHVLCRFECQSTIDLHHIDNPLSDYCRLGRTLYADTHSGMYGEKNTLWYPTMDLMALGAWGSAR